MFRLISGFISKVFSKITDFLKGLFNNAESVVVLSAAAIGANAVIQQMPFYLTLPLWIEATAVIPFISVLLVFTVVTMMEIRHNKGWVFN